MSDFGVDNGELLYLIMEYLDGRTVHDDISFDGPMAPKRVAHIARQVCDALDCAHHKGFIHRDLKPENIMLVSRDRDSDFVKVLDFGLAKLMTGPDGVRTKGISVSPLTRKGMVFGTPEYMSPEQASDLELTPSTDLYSLGVVMYEMVTGKLPFEGENFMLILAQHIQDTPVSPAARRPDLAIPPELDRLIMQCLAKRRRDRPADANALSARLLELEASLDTKSSRLPSQVASSSTVDLDAMAVRQAADAGATTFLGPPDQRRADGKANRGQTAVGAHGFDVSQPYSRQQVETAETVGLESLGAPLAKVAAAGRTIRFRARPSCLPGPDECFRRLFWTALVVRYRYCRPHRRGSGARGQRHRRDLRGSQAAIANVALHPRRSGRGRRCGNDDRDHGPRQPLPEAGRCRFGDGQYRSGRELGRTGPTIESRFNIRSRVRKPDQRRGNRRRSSQRRRARRGSRRPATDRHRHRGFAPQALEDPYPAGAKGQKGRKSSQADVRGPGGVETRSTQHHGPVPVWRRSGALRGSIQSRQGVPIASPGPQRPGCAVSLQAGRLRQLRLTKPRKGP